VSNIKLSFSWNSEINKVLEQAHISQEMALSGAVLIGLVFIFLIRGRLQNRKIRNWRARFENAHYLIETIKAEKGLENNAGEFLQLFDKIIDASVYAFYVYEPRNHNYVLKAIRSNKNNNKPSKDGLDEKIKEVYEPLLSVQLNSVPKKMEQVNEGEVPLLLIPIGEKQGLIQIGPVKFKIKKRQRKQLEELSDLVLNGLSGIISADKLKSESDVVISSGRAMQQISSITLNPNMTIDLMIRLCMQTIHASGGCYVEKQGELYSIPVSVEMDNNTTAAFEADTQILQQFESLIQYRGYEMIKRNDERINPIPAYLNGIGNSAFAAVRMDENSNSFLIFWFNRMEQDEIELGVINTMRLLNEEIRDIISHQLSLKQMSGSYSGILKGLALLLDNSSPYTIGYSEMMSRYCIIIAKEMGLEESEIRDIALAAYLSNIGMFGISTELYQKEGKYTDQEFELMKLHCDVGASIVQTTVANQRVADIILHHHERMDGNGYPKGLKNTEIPVGSRIIAIVQTFLAKINGRKYRDPLPFHQALQTLRAASGSQLDSEIVELFIIWFQKKQRNPNFNARSLGSCWEMLCVPSSVCENCPVFGRLDVNCWEVENNNCAAHGKKCDTCFVHTEFTHRAEMVK
jgi:HD-GYP domain-containing protein (c-di-GMP phosphodiesterase class II)